ncbi:hypothetical protein CORT_0E03960 [Candida orthopsilosis Co 90-125]|uniref:Uncharacterized protein n=1 Tax=Candida orthopsilosis (strain 90-125) TaxID=1136231 RepID=H8X755_CANO9|nr:hypothetical protein CORT_0E03960 [Candida orthopsilosis Co 90-125]CCG23983.1 hypothetical protein CORT_0E03960 [Candida orthopsilosis Co 90-125]
MSLRGVCLMGIGVPVYPGCNEFELIYNCLIAIPYNLRAEYLKSNGTQIRTLQGELGNENSSQVNVCIEKVYQIQADGRRTHVSNVKSVKSQSKTTDKNEPDKHCGEESIIFAEAESILPASKEPVNTIKPDTFSAKRVHCIGENMTASLKDYNKEPIIIPISGAPRLQIGKRNKWDILYATKIKPFLPTFWQGSLPSGRNPTFVHVRMEIARITGLNKKSKSACEDEMRYYDEMVHFHLLFDEDDPRVKTRNELESKLYIRVMSLYYIVMSSIPDSIETDWVYEFGAQHDAEKLPKFGKIANGVFKFLTQLVKQWDKLPVSKIRFIGQVNQTLEIMLAEIEKEIEKVVKAVEEINHGEPDVS